MGLAGLNAHPVPPQWLLPQNQYSISASLNLYALPPLPTKETTMTIQTSWEMMQQYREALDLAKWRKQVRAEHMEQIRLAGDYVRSLRYWLTFASSHRSLEARKAALKEHLARINSLQTRQAVTFCCETKLVGDSCQSNTMPRIRLSLVYRSRCGA